jgi:hypothetical protein
MRLASQILVLLLVSLSIGTTAPLSCSLLFAQDSNATIKGAALDESGAVAPGTTISVKNTMTGITSVGKTGPDGAYRIIVPGNNRYEIVADLRGFFRETCVIWVLSARETSVDFLLRAEPTHGYGDVIIVGQKPGEPYMVGSIQGQVIGEFGRGVSHARVVARDEATRREYAAEAREDGTFFIRRLPEGRYDVKAGAQRYKPEHLTAVIEYAVNAALKFDLIGL